METMEQLSSHSDKKDLGSKIIVFSIKDGKTGKNLDYGVSVDQVQEIGTGEEVTRVPGAPEHIIGVMNLRGKIITIVDMRKFLGIEAARGDEEKHSSSARIIVAQVGVSMVGLLDVVETWARICGYSYRLLPKDGKDIYVIQHNMGKKWSLMISELLRQTYEDFSKKPPEFDTSENIVSFRVDNP